MIHEYRDFNELEKLTVLIRDVWREHYTPIIGGGQVEYMLDKFQSVETILRQINEENYHYYGLLHEGQLAAYYAVQPQAKNKIFLSKFYVAAAFRGQGFGKKMLQHLIDNYVTPNETTIWLTVNKENRDSITIYQKLGFAITESMITDVGNGFVMDDYRMERRV
ncbi:MAG: GNAT family N-acetyltransferase [Planctomycetaceae bacterium]|jgi:GNAT superfamily N-acetyltransferase|nr:GNAT family N-acetyltransferase [Planctomycetaceae bacterium]